MATAAADFRSGLALPRETLPAAPPPCLSLQHWRDCARDADIAAWDRLSARASEPNPFFESWYLLPSLAALDPRGEVKLLLFEQHGEWLGLLPIVRAGRYYRYPVPQLRSWVHANCFLGAPLVAKGQELAFWRALLEWADANAGASLFLHLTQLPLSGPLHDALNRVLGEQKRPAGLVHREDRAMLASSLAPEAYLEAALSAPRSARS